MKTKLTQLLLLLAAFCFAFMTSCSGNKKDAGAELHEDHAGHDHLSDSGPATGPVDPQFQVDPAFQKQLGKLFTAYVSLKDAFVSSDAEKVRTEASNTTQALAKVDMKLLSGVAHNDWMTYMSGIQGALKDIRDKGNIEEQRKAFSTLSDNMYKSIKAFGLGGAQAFYEYCPMAFNNEGAYWLSDSEKIRNPYFGDKMLTCGSVKEKLK